MSLFVQHRNWCLQTVEIYSRIYDLMMTDACFPVRVRQPAVPALQWRCLDSSQPPHRAQHRKSAHEDGARASQQTVVREAYRLICSSTMIDFNSQTVM